MRSRRARPMRATLKLVGYSAQFESLMRIYKVWIPLAQSGVILQPKEYAEAEAQEQQEAQDSQPFPAHAPHGESHSATPGSDRAQPRPAV